MRLYSLALKQYEETILRKFYDHIPTKKEVFDFLKEKYAHFVYDKDSYSQWSTYEDYIDTLLNKNNFNVEYEIGDLDVISYVDVYQEEDLTLYLEETVKDDYKDANVEFIEDEYAYDYGVVKIL